MNKHILMLVDHQLNPAKYTKEQLDKNAEDADNVDAAYVYSAAAYAYADIDADYWLDKHFENTGENKQDYIDAINKDNK